MGNLPNDPASICTGTATVIEWEIWSDAGEDPVIEPRQFVGHFRINDDDTVELRRDGHTLYRQSIKYHVISLIFGGQFTRFM